MRCTVLLQQVEVTSNLSPSARQVPAGATPMYYAMRKGLPYKRVVDHAYIRLAESGLLKRMNDKYKPGPPNCDSHHERNVTPPVSLRYITNAYWMLGGGFALAAALTLVEMVYSKAKPRPNQRKNSHLCYLTTQNSN